jgi:hypothetical protein
MTLAFSKNSGLLIQARSRVATAMGEVPITVTLSDYRAIDGVMLPFSAMTESLGQQRELVVESISHNVELEKDFFRPDAEILELAATTDGDQTPGQG